MTIDATLQSYFEAYEKLVVHEAVDDSVILSFPLHLAANHRIEISVTEINEDRYILSDGGRTLSEIEAIGQSVSQIMVDRFERLASLDGIQLVSGYFVLETECADLGLNIQRFLEFCKTVGDVYLVHKQREESDKRMIAQVASVLIDSGIHFKRDKKITGQLESHPFDIFVVPNGVPGMALKVLSGQNTHSTAQIWAYKCEDIRRGNPDDKSRPKIALVYDERNRWSDASKSILKTRADIALPSSSIDLIPEQLGSLKRHE